MSRKKDQAIKDEAKRAFQAAITPELTAAFKAVGAMGGRAAAKNMTREELSARATKAVKARWAKRDV